MRYTLLLVFLAGCATTNPDPSNALSTANCPKELPQLSGDSFGDTTAKLLEVAGIYHRCRVSALGAQK